MARIVPTLGSGEPPVMVPHLHIACWPISEVTARLIEVRSVRHTGLDLLRLSSSLFDPKVTQAGQSSPGCRDAEK